MDELPTGTVTLLFTDMEGSTRLLQQVGERYADVLETFRHLLRMAFHQSYGHEIDTQGDDLDPLLWSKLKAMEQALANREIPKQSSDADKALRLTKTFLLRYQVRMAFVHFLDA
jgi:class 3 adenylate cyclase